MLHFLSKETTFPNGAIVIDDAFVQVPLNGRVQDRDAEVRGISIIECIILKTNHRVTHNCMRIMHAVCSHVCLISIPRYPFVGKGVVR